MTDPGIDAVKARALSMLADLRRLEGLFGSSDEIIEQIILAGLLDTRLDALKEMKELLSEGAS